MRAAAFGFGQAVADGLGEAFGLVGQGAGGGFGRARGVEAGAEFGKAFDLETHGSVLELF